MKDHSKTRRNQESYMRNHARRQPNYNCRKFLKKHSTKFTNQPNEVKVFNFLNSCSEKQTVESRLANSNIALADIEKIHVEKQIICISFLIKAPLLISSQKIQSFVFLSASDRRVYFVSTKSLKSIILHERWSVSCNEQKLRQSIPYISGNIVERKPLRICL